MFKHFLEQDFLINDLDIIWLKYTNSFKSYETYTRINLFLIISIINLTLWACLGSAYFAETENFLLKVL